MRVDSKKRLMNYAKLVVQSFGQRTDEGYDLLIDKLPELEQQELTRLLIEVYGVDMEFMHNDDITCNLLHVLKDNTTITRSDLCEVIIKNVLNAHQGAMQDILDEAAHDILDDINEDKGFKA